MDTPVAIIVALISKIMGLPKDGPDPSQYFRGRDNDKRLSTRLKKRYGLNRDGWAYHINNINDHTVCINTRILASKVVWKN